MNWIKVNSFSLQQHWLSPEESEKGTCLFQREIQIQAGLKDREKSRHPWHCCLNHHSTPCAIPDTTFPEVRLIVSEQFFSDCLFLSRLLISAFAGSPGHSHSFIQSSKRRCLMNDELQGIKCGKGTPWPATPLSEWRIIRQVTVWLSAPCLSGVLAHCQGYGHVILYLCQRSYRFCLD